MNLQCFLSRLGAGLSPLITLISLNIQKSRDYPAATRFRDKIEPSDTLQRYLAHVSLRLYRSFVPSKRRFGFAAFHEALTVLIFMAVNALGGALTTIKRNEGK